MQFIAVTSITTKDEVTCKQLCIQYKNVTKQLQTLTITKNVTNVKLSQKTSQTLVITKRSGTLNYRFHQKELQRT